MTLRCRLMQLLGGKVLTHRSYISLALDSAALCADCVAGDDSYGLNMLSLEWCLTEFKWLGAVASTLRRSA